MFVPREGLLSQFGQSFNDSIRPSLPTVAEPTWFAPPIDVRDENGMLTLVFHVAGYAMSDLRIEASGRSVFVLGAPAGARRPTRVFALPFDVCPHDLLVHRAGDLLHVRILKNTERVPARPPLPVEDPRRETPMLQTLDRFVREFISKVARAMTPRGNHPHIQLNKETYHVDCFDSRPIV